MTTAKWVIALTTLVLVGNVACWEEPGRCGEVSVTAECSSDLDSRERCLAEGGCWDVWCLAPEASCNCPTTDHGEACASASDCQGMCLLDEGDPTSAEGCPAVAAGSCSEMTRSFGCMCYLDSDGAAQGICAD